MPDQPDILCDEKAISVEKGRETGVCLDFREAFNLASHKILIDKLMEWINGQ